MAHQISIHQQKFYFINWWLNGNVDSVFQTQNFTPLSEKLTEHSQEKKSFAAETSLWKIFDAEFRIILIVFEYILLDSDGFE